MHRRSLLGSLIALAALAALRPTQAQDAAKPFKPEELDQMLAPIALYPDALLAQTLMAASYPLEVVEAARWSQSNPNLKGDAAVTAVKDKSWDVSVKSLTAFPQVLAQMSKNLDWMQKVGDAMVAQEQDVADSIQRLRAKAADAGSLKSGKEQTVTTQGSGADRTIVIEPASPDIVYVPTYDSRAVYGTWPSPAYPPTYYPPPPGYGFGTALMQGLMFGAGIAATTALFGAWNWGRGNSYVNVNVNRAVNIDRTFNTANINNGRWQHDTTHRKGVAYRDAASRQRFNQHRPDAAARQEFRGRLQSGGGHLPRQANAHPQLAHRPGGQGIGQGGGLAGNHPRLASHAGGRAGNLNHPNFQGRAGGISHGGGAIRGVDHGQRVNRQAARGRAQQMRAGGHARGGGFRGGRR